MEKQVYMEGEALSFGQMDRDFWCYLGREQAGGVQQRNLHRDGMKPSMDEVTQGECQETERSKIIYTP